MDEDNLTRVEADAEDRVRLVAQRPAPAVEEIGLHRFTLPFRSPTRPRGPFRNRGRRAAGDESGLRASGAERTRETGILRAGGPAEAFPLPLSMICQPNACRRPMCAPGFVAAPTLGPVRGSVPRGMGGRCRTWCCGRTTGNTSPCELLAVVCGVVLHEALDEALDELIDRAGLGQAALAGLVGQLVLGEALVALPGPAAGLLGLFITISRSLLYMLSIRLSSTGGCQRSGTVDELQRVRASVERSWPPMTHQPGSSAAGVRHPDDHRAGGRVPADLAAVLLRRGHSGSRSGGGDRTGGLRPAGRRDRGVSGLGPAPTGRTHRRTAGRAVRHADGHRHRRPATRAAPRRRWCIAVIIPSLRVCPCAWPAAVAYPASTVAAPTTTSICASRRRPALRRRCSPCSERRDAAAAPG